MPENEQEEDKDPKEKKEEYEGTITFHKKKGDSKDDKKDKDSGEGEGKPEDKEEKDSKEGGQDDKKGDKDKKDGDKDEPKKKPIYKKPWFIITAIIVFILIVAIVLIVWLIKRQYVSTDDAYIDSHIIQVSSQVGARVQTLRVEDNQLMRQGDLLIELDPTDYQVALDQSIAQVSQSLGKYEQMMAQVETAKASLLQAAAQEHSAQSSLDNANKDLARYQQVDERARSRQQLDSSSNSKTNAESQVDQAHAQFISAEANIVSARAAVKAAQGDLEAARAGQKRAAVNLSYCKIYAPCDGRVTQRTVEAGNYVSTGQALFMLVDPNVWITANFKETQLTLMQPGQDVTVTVDAFPKMKLHGKVDSIQAGSGSRFSVLPAENATGNFVKIVQRVPVKIVFDHDANTNNAPMLSPGLSVLPKVKVR